jgi:protein TonB
MAIMLGVAMMVSIGAHQGFEVRQHLLENNQAAGAETPLGGVQVAVDRTAWVKGIDNYSKLASQQFSEATPDSQRDAFEKAPTANVQPEPTASEREAPEDGQGKESGPEQSVALSRESPLGESPSRALSAPPLQNFNTMSDEALLLAGMFMPSLALQDGEPVADGILKEHGAKSRITAETVVTPVYPFKARRKRLDGYVRLEFSVTGAGKANDIRVVEARPSDIFEKAAINALQKWVFKVGGEHSENRRLSQVFDFDMEDDAPKLAQRDHRCDITGSRICGLRTYNSKK